MASASPQDFSMYDYIDTPVFVVSNRRSGGYRMLYANTAHAQNTGLDPHVIRGQPVNDIFPPSLATLMTRNYDAALTLGKPYRFTEALSLSGEEKWYETTLIAMPKARDGKFRIVGTSKDVTLRTKQAMEDRVTRLDFERFLGIAAHDLRIPMRQVSEIARLLGEDFKDLGDGKTELIQTLDDIGTNAVKLVEDILTFVEADSLKAKTEKIALDALCQQLLSLFDLERKHRIDVTPGILETDPLVLQIILRNLIDNSLKHGGSDALSIRIEVSAETDALVNLWYSDDGRGLEGRDVLLTETSSADARQNGYGLATVRRLLRARGGNISVTPSRFGHGAGFALVVPGHLQLLG